MLKEVAAAAVTATSVAAATERNGAATTTVVAAIRTYAYVQCDGDEGHLLGGRPNG